MTCATCGLAVYHVVAEIWEHVAPTASHLATVDLPDDRSATTVEEWLSH